MNSLTISPETVAITWITIPFFLGFVIYLAPKIDRYLALSVTIISAVYALQIFATESSIKLQLLDNFGVTLIIDQLSAYFILTNALVTAAVIIYCWHSGKSAFFYAQMIILHGSLNAAFAGADFISLYVALEVSGIAAFLLITYPRSDRSIWVGLRYLFVSNIAMLFYLVGAVIAYRANQSFAFSALQGAPPEAVALLFMGLLVKGGVFVSGLWLPLTHSESDTPVSALLSGIVVKAGVYPLVRCALMVAEVEPIVRIFGVGAAFLGVFCSILEKDTKRTLAWSTISQLGWILAAPAVAGFYALAHGLVKSTLFLIAGNLPSRDIKELQQKPLDTRIWIALVIASLSISGFPFVVGFGAKVSTLKNLVSWQEIAMNIAAVGTVIVFARFLFLPRGAKANIRPGFLLSITFLLAALIAASAFYWEAYTLLNMLKAVAIISVGVLAYLVVFRRTTFKLPRVLEQFEHLVGFMTLVSILLFWMALA